MATTSFVPKAPSATRSQWTSLAGSLLLLVGGIAALFAIRAVGGGLAAPEAPPDARPVGVGTPGQVDVVLHVVATLVAVIALGFVLGRLLRRVGQPPVIGEMIAGILLGPSLLGAVSPEAMHLFIPSAAADPKGQVSAALNVVSQLGIILYMFLVGLELNAARLKNQAPVAVSISLASIVVPFVMGAGLALGLYPVFSHALVPFTSFALFIGVAMAITAFPVLARILTDRGENKTEIGMLALSCAAAGDVIAWCLLALVVGVARAEVDSALWITGGAVAFMAFMFVAARPLVTRFTHALESRSGPLPPLAISGTFLAVLVCALTTEAIGIHAVFGAFLLGAVIPHESRLAREFHDKLKDPVTVLLLPAFFASTGMRMQIGLVSGWENWLWCLAIVLVAIVGKFGGTFAAARLSGLDRRSSAAMGTLMNTRGLMELIVLNIGLDLGVISPTLFAMLVIMALATTAITSPVLQWLMPPASPLPRESSSAWERGRG